MAIGNIRDYLNTLQAGTQGLASFNDSVKDQNLITNQKQFQADLPQLLASNDTAGLVASGLRAGYTKPLDVATTNAFAEAVPKLDEGQIAALGFKGEEAAALTGLNSDRQQQYIKMLNEKRLKEDQMASNAEDRKYKRALTGEAMSRKDEIETQKERKGFAQDYDKFERTIKSDEKDIRAVQQSLKAGTKPDDAIIFNFLARKVAGEKGPLSEGDVQRFIGSAFAGKQQEFENFVKGGSTSSLTPAQRQAYNDMIQRASANFDTYKAESLGSILKNATTTYPRLTKDGLDPSIIQRAEDRGFELKKNDKGWYDVSTKPTENKISNIAAPDGKNSGDQLTRIHALHPRAQAIVLKNLNSESGKTLTPEQIDTVIKQAEAASKGLK